MRSRSGVLVISSALVVAGFAAQTSSASAERAAPRAVVARVHHPGFVLTTTKPGGPGMAPAFVGNGYLAGREPFDGQGYAQVRLPGQTDPLPTQSEVHGLYALGVPEAPPGSPPPPKIERRAALPAWSTLTYSDGSGAYRLSRGTVSGYRQQLHLRTGTLTTSLTADARIRVSADDHTWRTLGTVDGTSLRGAWPATAAWSATCGWSRWAPQQTCR